MKLGLHLNELRAMEVSDLDERLRTARTELFNLRFQAATGQLENHRQIRMVKRQIAQVLTVLQGRSLGSEQVMAQPDAGIETRESGGRRRNRRVTAAAAPEAAGAVATATAEPETAEAEPVAPVTSDVETPAQADATVPDVAEEVPGE